MSRLYFEVLVLLIWMPLQAAALRILSPEKPVAVVVRMPGDPLDLYQSLLRQGMRLEIYTVANDAFEADDIISGHDSPELVRIHREVPNHGQEVPKYIDYILRNYEGLPERIAFLHGHQGGWHDPRIKRNAISSKLQQHAGSSKFISHLNWPECERNYVDTSLISDTTWAALFREEFGVKPLPFPQGYFSPCCSQFITSGESIRQHSKEFYQKIADYALDDQQPSLLESGNTEGLREEVSLSEKRLYTSGDPEARDERSSEPDENKHRLHFRKSQALERMWSMMFIPYRGPGNWPTREHQPSCMS